MSEKRLVDELHASARRNFPRRDVTVTDTPVAGGCDQCILIRNSIEVLNILTVIDVLSQHAWAESLKVKNGKWWRQLIIRNDGRRLKNLYWQRKRILQLGCAKIFEEAQHQPLFYVFRTERLNRRMVKPRWKMTCGNNLRTMKITNGSTSYRVSYQITTPANIELLVCIPSMLPSFTGS